ncbi:hypothetical protein LOD99_891 [Oopsacas minuta]|uniref:Transposable element P transposase-like RNase H domain-containing protein n=1 Tax=Oopsacas minuta TaxID=111878 RepID=A0AAV7K091_9METZ|nr:hypothetical protein LOD99_891 [Oopsacas minuta]
MGFYEGIRIPLSLTQINDIRQLNDLLKEIENHSAPTNSPETFQRHIREATGSIRKAIDSLSTGEESGNQQPLLSSLQFILCQLDNALIAKTMRRYNIETLVLSLKCQLISPVCYRYLQSLDCLSLPHLSTLKRLYSNFGLDSEFTNYLKQSVTQFNKWERNVVIQMDEIHVKSTFTYKGGKLIGSSLNPTDPAKTVFAFMISSLSKRWSSIVRLLPCSSSSAEVLFPIIKDVIRDVEACGLSVHVLCTDNYPMNVNIFKLFSPSRLLEHIVPHPMDSNRPLFLLFDFVHIIKSIRNNWLNQIDYNKTFTYPDFENIQVASTAVFEEIRKLYKSDQHSVAKLAPRLTSKACWPSTLERQNVSLALRIFDESTPAALNVSYQSRYHTSTNSQTADIIPIICNVWKIFNINTPNKGILHKDEFSVPLTYNDTRFMFLQRVVDWAECWQVMPDKRGKLSPQTFTSFRHSCISLPCIVNHLAGNCGYSMMSGAQYHTSYCQALETERRIKLSSILKLFSKKPVEDSISLKNFLESCSSSCDQDSHASFSLEMYLSAIQGYSGIELNKQILQSLSFIAGYSVHAYYKHSTKCQSCLLFLTENKEMEIEEPSDSEYRLIQIIDRGSLKWPSSDVIDAIITLWKVFSSIESQPSIFNSFITGPSRSILIQLTTSLIEDEQAEVWRVMCDECGTLMWDVLAKLLTATSNCLMSNKIKNMNSQLPLKPCVENTRKLKKLKPN